MRRQVRSLALLSGLRIQPCYELSCSSLTWLRSYIAVAQASKCSSSSTPSLGTSTCCRCSPKKQNKQTNKQNKRLYNLSHPTPLHLKQSSLKKKQKKKKLRLYFCFNLFLLRPHPQHMEVPWPGVKSELHLSAFATATASWDLSVSATSQQQLILNPLSKARDRTRNLTIPSQIHFCCATTRVPQISFSHISPAQPPATLSSTPSFSCTCSLREKIHSCWYPGVIKILGTDAV